VRFFAVFFLARGALELLSSSRARASRGFLGACRGRRSWSCGGCSCRLVRGIALWGIGGSGLVVLVLARFVMGVLGRRVVVGVVMGYLVLVHSCHLILVPWPSVYILKKCNMVCRAQPILFTYSAYFHPSLLPVSFYSSPEGPMDALNSWEETLERATSALVVHWTPHCSATAPHRRSLTREVHALPLHIAITGTGPDMEPVRCGWHTHLSGKLIQHTYPH